MAMWFFSFNPVFLRDMRQAVRNRFVLVSLQVYIALLVVASSDVIVNSGLFLNSLPFGNSLTCDGRGLFAVVHPISFIFSALIVLIHTGGRVITERLNDDAMFVTTLRPFQIVFGKFLSGVMLSFLIYSITAPFIMLAVFLRGLDMGGACFSFLFSFCFVQTLNAILLGTLSGTRSLFDLIPRMIAFLLLVCAMIFLLFLCILNIIVASIVLAEGEPQPSYWLEWLSILYFYCFISLGMFLLALAQYSSPSNNRMLPLRVSLTFACLPFLFLVGDFLTIQILLLPFSVLCVIAMFERNEYRVRLRRSIPTTPFKRICAFPFYTGDCNAFVWLNGCLLVLFALYVFVEKLTIYDYHSYGEYGLANFSNCVMFFNYTLAATFLQRHLPQRYVPKNATWIVFLALLAMGAVLSMLLTALISVQSSSWLVRPLVLIPDPFVLNWKGDYWEYSSLRIGFAFFWFAASEVLLIGWTMLRFQQFTRESEPQPQDHKIA